MKIAIFSDNFYPELSGISDSVILLAKELAKLGHEINFYAPKYSAKNYRAINLPVKELALDSKINVNRLFSLPASFAGLQARLVLPLFSRRLFRKFKPDIIHSQLFFGAGLEARLKSKFKKIPIIGTNHTRLREFIKIGAVKLSWVASPMMRYMIWYYNSCDYVTAPAKNLLDEMIADGMNRPLSVISNPVDDLVFNRSIKISKNHIKERYGLAEKVVIYAGRLAYEKNIDIIIRAMQIVKKKFPEINLALAGDGQAREALVKLTKELKMESNVKFLGTQNHHDLADLYRTADIFAMASTSEVQSMTIIQGMACGLPIVGVDYNSIPELVNNDNGLLFKVGDHKDLAEKLIKLLSDSDLKRKLSRGAYDFVQQFSAPVIAKKWVKLYERVIADYHKKFDYF